MTVSNGHQNPNGESSDRTTDILDELLAALRTDQGGARTEALKLALELEGSDGSAGSPRFTDLHASVEQLATGNATATDIDVEARIEDLESAVEGLADRLESVESSAQAVQAELEATRDTLDASVAAESSGATADQSDAELADRVRHLEKVLNTRTSSLASKINKIGDVEERFDERMSTLEDEVEEVNETLEEAATILQSETSEELENVAERLEVIEDDIDTLEWHAVDMIQWRKSYEKAMGDPEDVSDANE